MIASYLALFWGGDHHRLLVSQQRAILMLVVLLIISVPSTARSDDQLVQQRLDEKGCSGAWYGMKVDDVPVYEDASLDSKVVTRLKVNEQVCYIGEQAGFAVVLWKLDVGEASKTTQEKQLVFVRLVDISLPEAKVTPQAPADFTMRLRQYINYIRYGGVVDDPLFIIRPLLDLVTETEHDKQKKITEHKAASVETGQQPEKLKEERGQ